MNDSDVSFIDYDNKVQNALRGVVRDVLDLVSQEGLQGEHHFYITFRTQAEGVGIPPRLYQRFPEEMTIVLQHKFWSLNVQENSFSVGLSFDRKIETLTIPFTSIVGFVDPSEKFALQFQGDDDSVDDFNDEDGLNDTIFTVKRDLAQSDEVDPATGNNLLDTRKTNLSKKQDLTSGKGADTSANIKNLSKIGTSKRKNASHSDIEKPDGLKSDKNKPDSHSSRPDDAKSVNPNTHNPDQKKGGGDNVVTLDAFRKK